MKLATRSPRESERLHLLNQLQLLDTGLEKAYDDITQLAAQICDVPVCLVSLIDSERLFFKSRQGFTVTEIPSAGSFCSHAIVDNQTFIIENAQEDARFVDHPLVTGDTHVRFYAGIPLEIQDELMVGTFCILDNRPRQLSPEQLKALECFAHQITTLMQLRLSVFELQNQNESLEAKAESKTNYFAAISHELRTPLSGIKGVAGMIKHETQGLEHWHRHQKSISVIENSCDNLINIVNHILDFAKAESGTLELEEHEFRVSKLAQDCLDLLSPLATQKGLKLHIDWQGQEIWSQGDSTKLSQVLINLLGNAIKFTQTGEINLSIQSKSDSADHTQWEFTLVDQGIGMTVEEQKRLFQPYAQANSSIQQRYGGTGLGLAISKNIVEAMGGQIQCQSTPGVGSTFIFNIVLKDKQQPHTLHSDTFHQLQSPLKILVAEDNQVNQLVIKHLLKQFELEPDLVSNGEEAVAKARAMHYDLILMDCKMPKLDGLEASSIIMGEQRERQPYICALTADISAAQQEACKAAGMDGFLTKPINKSDLALLLSIVIESTHIHPQ